MSLNERDIQQYHYDAKFEVENEKFQTKLYQLLYKHLPVDVVRSINHQSFRYSGCQGFYKTFENKNGKITRRYILGKDGVWFEAPDLLRTWVSFGYPVNDDNLEAFVIEIKKEYYIEGND